MNVGPAGGFIQAPAGPRLQRILLGLIAVGLIVAACGDDEPAEPTIPVPTEAGATSTRGPEPAMEFDIQGHRGARGLKPENTLPAFETALDLGVTTLELDLHFTSDGKVVVWHDVGIDRDKCGLSAEAPSDVPDPDDVLVASRDRRIRALTAEQLTGYQCDRNPDPRRFPTQTEGPTPLAGDDYHVVTLAELFDFVAAYSVSEAKTEAQRDSAAAVAFNIETKRKPDEPGTIGDGFDGVNAGAFELEVLRVVEEHGVADRVVIQSFDHRSLWAIRAADPNIELAALSFRESVDYEDLAARGATIWSPNQDVVTAESLGAAQAAGLLVIPWTVNDPDDMERLIGLGVDGLITDRPDLLVAMAAG